MNRALDSCGLGNILRVLAKTMDRKRYKPHDEEGTARSTSGGHYVGAHTKERGHPIVLGGADCGIELSPRGGGYLAEVVNKAHLYD